MTDFANHEDQTPRTDVEHVVRRARYAERERQAQRALTDRTEGVEYASLFDHVRTGR